VALQAAETGHLLLSTLHSVNATETVNRRVDSFPPFQQHQIRLTADHQSGDHRGDRARGAFDLWDYDSVRENVSDILKRIENGEAPFDNGWPKERVALLRSWMREGLMAPDPLCLTFLVSPSLSHLPCLTFLSAPV
jgi:hypothetical protein